VTAQAQHNSAVNLLDSPVKAEPTYNAGEAVVCTVALPATAALFGTDTVTGSTPGAPVFVTDELFGPGFRVWLTDEACNILSSWSTAFAGSTMTGIAVPNAAATSYWTIDPFGFSATRYTLPGGAVVPASTIPIPAGSLWGAAVVDDNQAGEVLCIDDIATDSYTCINAAAGGAFLCSYANADNAGTGAFGNGMGDAVAPAACSGATLVQSTGTINEGQVTRVGQYDCVTLDPACSDRWAVGSFSTFVNGIEEFATASALAGIGRWLAVVDNVTSVWLVLNQPIGIGDCQDIDANMDVLWANGSQGGGDFTVNVNTAGTLSVAMQKTTAGNGNFTFSAWAGSPSQATVSALFDLGNQCFNFLGGTAAIVANRVGKTNLIGASNYFNTPTADPAKAPTFVLSQAVVDTANMPIGGTWTGQGIALNPAASSTRGGSLSNGLIYLMQ
jgi:hypothetical protein